MDHLLSKENRMYSKIHHKKIYLIESYIVLRDQEFLKKFLVVRGPIAQLVRAHA